MITPRNTKKNEHWRSSKILWLLFLHIQCARTSTYPYDRTKKMRHLSKKPKHRPPILLKVIIIRILRFIDFTIKMFGHFVPMVSQVWMCCFDKFSLAENILMDNHSKKNFYDCCLQLFTCSARMFHWDRWRRGPHSAKLLMSIIDDSQFKGPSTQMHKLHKHKVSYQCSFVIRQHNTHQNHINQIININYK